MFLKNGFNKRYRRSFFLDGIKLQTRTLILYSRNMHTCVSKPPMRQVNVWLSSSVEMTVCLAPSPHLYHSHINSTGSSVLVSFSWFTMLRVVEMQQSLQTLSELTMMFLGRLMRSAMVLISLNAFSMARSELLMVRRFWYLELPNSSKLAAPVPCGGNSKSASVKIWSCTSREAALTLRMWFTTTSAGGVQRWHGF